MPRGTKFVDDEERKEGARARARRYLDANPEKRLEYSRRAGALRRARIKAGTLANVEEVKAKQRAYDAAWKRAARANKTEYAEATRVRKRSPEYRAKVSDARATDEQRAAGRAIRNRYAAKPGNAIKEAARSAVNAALQRGDMIRPDDCSRCGRIPARGRDGRSLIRADHYKGYEPEHWLTIQWICSRCDGELERERAQTLMTVSPATTESDG